MNQGLSIGIIVWIAVSVALIFWALDQEKKKWKRLAPTAFVVGCFSTALGIVALVAQSAFGRF